MLNIPERYDIKHLTVVDKQIYFIDNDNAIYTIDTKMGDSYYMNSLAASFTIEKLGEIEKMQQHSEEVDCYAEYVTA